MTPRTDAELEALADAWAEGNVRAERGRLIRSGVDPAEADRQARETVAAEARRKAAELRQ